MEQHETCGRCGRKLTTKKSVSEGYGPVCNQIVAAEKEKENKRLEKAKDAVADF